MFNFNFLQKRLRARIPHLFGLFPKCLVFESPLDGDKIVTERTVRAWQR